MVHRCVYTAAWPIRPMLRCARDENGERVWLESWLGITALAVAEPSTLGLSQRGFTLSGPSVALVVDPVVSGCLTCAGARDRSVRVSQRGNNLLTESCQFLSVTNRNLQSKFSVSSDTSSHTIRGDSQVRRRLDIVHRSDSFLLHLQPMLT